MGFSKKYINLSTKSAKIKFEAVLVRTKKQNYTIKLMINNKRKRVITRKVFKHSYSVNTFDTEYMHTRNHFFCNEEISIAQHERAQYTFKSMNYTLNNRNRAHSRAVYFSQLGSNSGHFPATTSKIIPPRVHTVTLAPQHNSLEQEVNSHTCTDTVGKYL